MSGKKESAKAKRSEKSGSGISSSSSKKRNNTLNRFKNSWKGGSFQEAKKERFSVCGFYRASESLPPIVEQTCKYLEQKALQSEGIFRISGSQEDVRRIKDKFDKGRKIDLSKEDNANTIAGVLKLFFTELKNPVLAHELYPSFMAAVEMPDPLLRIWCVRRTIATLPPGNRVVLDRVCAMFRIIARFADDNKMTSKNIALVMNPSMFRDKDEGLMGLLTTGGLRVRLVQLLIVSHEDLFVTPKSELQERVRELEPSMTLETQQLLDNFSNLLREGAILLAKNLLNEGETEIKVRFEDADAFSPPSLPTDEDMKKMSFEEFAAHMAIHPPGGIEVPGIAAVVSGNQTGRAKRSGFRFGTVNAPTKYNLNGEKRLSKCFSMGDLGADGDDADDIDDSAITPGYVSPEDNQEDLQLMDNGEEVNDKEQEDSSVHDFRSSDDIVLVPNEELLQSKEETQDNEKQTEEDEVKERFKGSPKADPLRKKRAKNRKKKTANLRPVRSTTIGEKTRGPPTDLKKVQKDKPTLTASG